MLDRDFLLSYFSPCAAGSSVILRVYSHMMEPTRRDLSCVLLKSKALQAMATDGYSTLLFPLNALNLNSVAGGAKGLRKGVASPTQGAAATEDVPRICVKLSSLKNCSFQGCCWNAVGAVFF